MQEAQRFVQQQQQHSDARIGAGTTPVADDHSPDAWDDDEYEQAAVIDEVHA